MAQWQCFVVRIMFVSPDFDWLNLVFLQIYTFPACYWMDIGKLVIRHSVSNVTPNFRDKIHVVGGILFKKR